MSVVVNVLQSLDDLVNILLRKHSFLVKLSCRFHVTVRSAFHVGLFCVQILCATKARVVIQ